MSDTPPFPVETTRRLTAWHIACLLLIICVALTIRLMALAAPIHFDELWHLELSTGRGSAHLTLPRDVLIERGPQLTSLKEAPPIWKIPASLSTVTHPPLYSMLLRLWRDCVGESANAGRLLSIAASIGCIVLIFDAARRLHTISTALWAAALMAVSAAQLEMAQQIRNYAVEEFCVLALVDAVICAQTLGYSKLRLAAVFATALAALFSHYFAVFAVAAIGVYVLIVFRGRTRIAVATTLCFSFVTFLILWLPMLHAQRAAIDDATTTTALYDPGDAYRMGEWVRLTLTPLRLLFEPKPVDALAPRFSCVLLLLPWLLIIRRPRLLLWILLFDGVIGSVVAMDLIRHTKHLTQIRHVIVAGIGLSVLIPLLVEEFKPWLRHGVPAVVVLACLGALTLPHWMEPRQFKEIGRLVGDPRYAKEPVIFLAEDGFQWKRDVDYLAAAQYSGTFPRPIVRTNGALSAEVLAQLRRWPGAVVVCEPYMLDKPQLFGYAEVKTLGFEPFIATVAHLTWPSPTTQPTTSAAAN